MEDYRDKIIERLIKINEEQIQVNAKFADVTEKNNSENQKTFKLLIVSSILAIVIVCVVAMFFINNKHYENKEIKERLNQIRIEEQEIKKKLLLIENGIKIK